MSREIENNPSPASHEIKNNISKVFIEKEKPYGIYLPEWDNVVEAVTVFAAGDFPLSKEDVAKEIAFRNTKTSDPHQYNQYTELELTTLNRFYTEGPTQPEEIDRVLLRAKGGLEKDGRAILYDSSLDNLSDAFQWMTHDFQGRAAAYGKFLSIESLIQKELGEEGPRFRKPYLLTMYSKFFEDNGEAKLAEELGRDRSVLPRKVIVQLGNEGGNDFKINFDDVSARVNSGLNTDISGQDMARNFFQIRLLKRRVTR